MYTDADKKVFPYFDGRGNVFGDPLRIWRRLNHMLEGDPNKFLAAAKDPSPEAAFEAKERVLEATRYAFEMPFDSKTGEGATEADCEAALNAFEAFLGKKKVSAATTPTSSPLTDSPRAYPYPTRTTAASTGTSRG